MSKHPLIGAALDFEEAGGWSGQPRNALRVSSGRTMSGGDKEMSGTSVAAADV